MTFIKHFPASLTLALCLGLSCGQIAAAQDFAQNGAPHYDGYCFTQKKQAQANGAVVGAIVGGVAGGSLSNTKHKGVGTVAGAVVGGLIGNEVGKSSVKCYNGEYYAYRNGQYSAPPEPPEGYQTLYFRDRPSDGYYDHVYDAPGSQNGGQVPQREHTYNQGEAMPGRSADQSTDQGRDYGSRRDTRQGFLDSEGQWHEGRPRAVGWQDDHGQWHLGEIVARGWRDDRGDWHEVSQPGQGSTMAH